MHCSYLLAFVVTIATVTDAIDLSHAQPVHTDVEPRFFSIINDFYAQVIHPPLNHIVTNLALLGAQVLAGISETGIPAPGRRALNPLDSRVKDLTDSLWNNAVRPRLEQALSGFSTLAAQILARIGNNAARFGKRDVTEAEMRNIFDDIWNNAVRPPVENALTDLSLLLAQVLAGLGTNGISLGKRDVTEVEMRNIFDDIWNNAVRPPVENALTDLSLILAQLLAGLGTNGVSLGKRDTTEQDMRIIGDVFTQAINNIFTNVFQKPLEDTLTNGALILAQILAGVGTNGVNLSSLIGKRDLTSFANREDEFRGLFDSFGQAVLNGLQSVWTNIFQDPLEQALQSSALITAQILAGIGTNGVNLG